ncbi:MAG: hypothetical protein ABSG86_24295 [Thermoguttaceae bacterium]|jgi:hypothetical protein
MVNLGILCPVPVVLGPSVAHCALLAGMENFAILLAICPGLIAFAAGMIYCDFLAVVVSPIDRLYPFLYVASLLVLLWLLGEVVLLLALGPAGFWALAGPRFFPAHLAVFFLSPPALANVLVLRPVYCKWYVAGVICALFAVFLVLLNFCVAPRSSCMAPW